MLGLLQASFGLTGFDAVSHMVEEVSRSTRQIASDTDDLSNRCLVLTSSAYTSRASHHWITG
jgi:hypothetical protein